MLWKYIYYHNKVEILVWNLNHCLFFQCQFQLQCKSFISMFNTTTCVSILKSRWYDIKRSITSKTYIGCTAFLRSIFCIVSMRCLFSFIFWKNFLLTWFGSAHIISVKKELVYNLCIVIFLHFMLLAGWSQRRCWFCCWCSAAGYRAF